jgi:hypothetical protein
MTAQDGTPAESPLQAPASQAAYDRERYQRLKFEIKARVKAAYWADPEPRRQAVRDFRIANLDLVKARDRDYRSRHAAQNRAKARDWRLANPERYAATKRAHYVANKTKYLARARRHKAALLRATPVWADLEAINDFYREAARVTRETGIPHDVDHVIPLQGKNVCGLHVETNLQVLPRAANRRKWNTLDDGAENGLYPTGARGSA